MMGPPRHRAAVLPGPPWPCSSWRTSRWCRVGVPHGLARATQVAGSAVAASTRASTTRYGKTPSRGRERQASSLAYKPTTRRLTVLLLKLVPHSVSMMSLTFLVLTPSMSASGRQLHQSAHQRLLAALVTLEQSGLEGALAIHRDQQLQPPDARVELPRAGTVAVPHALLASLVPLGLQVLADLRIQHTIQDNLHQVAQEARVVDQRLTHPGRQSHTLESSRRLLRSQWVASYSPSWRNDGSLPAGKIRAITTYRQ